MHVRNYKGSEILGYFQANTLVAMVSHRLVEDLMGLCDLLQGR